jgi:uncharacterized protein DUF1844
MPDEKDHGEGFKVVDRRLFSEDGKLREGVNEDAGRTAPAATPSRIATPNQPAPPAAREAPTRAHEEAQPFDEEPAADFEMLVSYLSTTVMFQLGLLPGPGGERISPDLANARRTIDLLGVLEQKTRGNLTLEEAQLLDDVLADLRMGYVETENRLAKKRK